MVKCLSSASFTMRADILRQTSGMSTPSAEGEWQDYQDPVTLEIIRRWVPIGDDPTTPGNEGETAEPLKCFARGIIDGGIRVAGTTERWGETYVDIDYVRIEFPKNKILTKRDRITNIRDPKGHIIWLEEEVPPEDSDSNPDTPKTFRATVFDVLGVTPKLGPFNQHMSNVAMLQRSEVQQNG